MFRRLWLRLTTYDNVASHDEAARARREQEKKFAEDVARYFETMEW